MSTYIRCGSRSAILHDKADLRNTTSLAAGVVRYAIENPEQVLWDFCLGASKPHKLTVVRNGRKYPDFRVEPFSVHAPWCPCPIGTHGSGLRMGIEEMKRYPLIAGLPLGPVYLDLEDRYHEQAEAVKLPSDFGCWISEAISHAVTEGFLSSNPNIARLEIRATKSADYLVRSIQQRLDDTLLVGTGSLVQALSARGDEVALGWSTQPLAKQISELAPGSCYTTRHPRVLLVGDGEVGRTRELMIRYPQAVSKFIHGRAVAQHGYHAAPYFFAALGKRVGDQMRASRVYIHPVFGLSGAVTFTDSGPENKFTWILWAAHLPFFKPPRLYDTNRLVQKLTTLGPEAVVLKYRPDFLIFYQGTLFVVEISGRKDVDYLCHLTTKMDHYEVLGLRSRIVGIRYDSDNLPDPQSLIRHLRNKLSLLDGSGGAGSQNGTC